MSPPPPQINDHAELGNVTLFGLHMLPRRDHNGVDWALNPVWVSLGYSQGVSMSVLPARVGRSVVSDSV